jgi:folylpolyglutamate synthase/dihydropteroate synthase
VFDAAHNPDGCEALARYLASEKRRPRVLVFGAMADKNYPRMLAILAAQVEHVIYLVPKLARAASHAQLQACVPGIAARAAGDALARARSAAGSGGLIVCAGSIFAVSELRAKALGLPSDPLIRM